jgi:hypothetical protein
VVAVDNVTVAELQLLEDIVRESVVGEMKRLFIIIFFPYRCIVNEYNNKSVFVLKG